jgi:hypothetical protein
MAACYRTQSDPLRHCLFAGADATSAPAEGIWKQARTPRGRAFSLLALLGASVILMATPAVVAAISIIDGSFLEPIWARLQIGNALAPCLDFVRWGSALALAGMVARAIEDE